MEKEALFGKNLTELKKAMMDLGLPGFTGQQLADWLYKKHAFTFEEMTNLSKNARQLLSERCIVGVSSPLSVQTSSDGTRKYLFATHSSRYIETAMIPDKDRVTVCVSSQVGCKMGCLFCMTGRQGFNGQISAGEIVNQIRSIEERDKVSNIVYMGMGEPFDNMEAVMKSIELLTAEWGYAMSPRRITVSSIGIIPGLRKFLLESHCNLAISLHTPFDNEREQLMPVQKAYPISEVIREIRSMDLEKQRKLSFEYIVFGGFNDTPAHAKELARLFNGIRSHVNLIRFHPIPGTLLKQTNEEQLLLFKDMLNKKGVLTTIRASRGQDIDAACGLLSTRKLTEKQD
jgi:23S rRNA (adenine2503-C2)-methyltransferase